MGSRGDQYDTRPANTLDQLVKLLSRHCGERGDNEGAVETLERIIREREILLKNAIKRELLTLR